MLKIKLSKKEKQSLLTIKGTVAECLFVLNFYILVNFCRQ